MSSRSSTSSLLHASPRRSSDTLLNGTSTQHLLVYLGEEIFDPAAEDTGESSCRVGRHSSVSTSDEVAEIRLLDTRCLSNFQLSDSCKGERNSQPVWHPYRRNATESAQLLF